MRWVVAFTKSNGALRKHFGSLQIPKECPVRDRQLLTLRVDFGEEPVTDVFKVSSGRELLLSKPLADRIEAVAKRQPHGVVVFNSTEATDATLLEDIYAAAGLPSTERMALIAARLGQGRFRDQLMRVWDGRCAVTGIDVPSLLRAAHIKPWCLSDDEERLDAHNGLLLVANLDAAFDARLISFDGSGLMLFSAALGPEPRAMLGIPREPHLAHPPRLTRPPSPKQQKFLAQHREEAGLA